MAKVIVAMTHTNLHPADKYVLFDCGHWSIAPEAVDFGSNWPCTRCEVAK